MLSHIDRQQRRKRLKRLKRQQRKDDEYEEEKEQFFLLRRRWNNVFHMFILSLYLSFFQFEENQRPHGGSSPGKSRNINRDFTANGQALYDNYFAPNCRYNSKLFRRRYRMPKALFIKLHDAITEFDPYFKQTKNCAGKLGNNSSDELVLILTFN